MNTYRVPLFQLKQLSIYLSIYPCQSSSFCIDPERRKNGRKEINVAINHAFTFRAVWIWILKTDQYQLSRNGKRPKPLFVIITYKSLMAQELFALLSPLRWLVFSELLNMFSNENKTWGNVGWKQLKINIVT